MGRRRSGPSKAEQRRQRAEGLSRNDFAQFISEAKSARQELDDATTAHAGVFKKGDGLGIHLGAVKLFLQLDRMEDTKRRDFLRAFDQYRSWADYWDAQPDLLEAEGEAPTERAEEPAEIEETEREPLAAAAADPVGDVEEAVATLESDWGDDQAAGEQPELERAGFVYGEGQKAGAEGHGAEANPYGATSPLHAIWERGRANPAQAEETEEAAEAEVERLVPRRRRRRAADDTAAAALH